MAYFHIKTNGGNEDGYTHWLKVAANDFVINHVGFKGTPKEEARIEVTNIDGSRTQSDLITSFANGYGNGSDNQNYVIPVATESAYGLDVINPEVKFTDTETYFRFTENISSFDYSGTAPTTPADD